MSLLKRVLAAATFVALALVSGQARAGVAVGVGTSAAFGSPGVALPGGVFAQWSPARANVTLDGSGNVSAVADSSGNGHTLTQSTAGLRPGWTASSSLKGASAVLFNGATYLDSGTFSLPEPHTVLWVMQTSVGGSGPPAIFDATTCSNRAAAVAQDPNPGTVSVFPSVGGCPFTMGLPADLSAAQVPSVGYTFAGGIANGYVSGQLQNTGAGCAAYTMTSQRWGAACTGSSDFASGPWTQGVLWSRALSSGEMSLANLYATIFWGATNSSEIMAWTPASLPGVTFLVDPASATYSGIADGANVATLYDAAGSGATMTQTEGVLPTMDRSTTLGGYPTIKFGSGATLYKTTGGLSGNQSHTIYLVVRNDLISSYRLMAAFGQIGTVPQSGLGSMATPMWWAGGDGDIGLTGSAPSQVSPTSPGQYAALAADTTTFHLLTLTYDSVTGIRRLYVDGFLSANPGAGVYGMETLSSPSFPAGLGFMPHAAGFESQERVAYAAFCVGSAHNATTRWQMESWLRTRAGASLGYSVAGVPQLLALGNSLTAGEGLASWQTQSYPAQTLALMQARPGLSSMIMWDQGWPGIGVITAVSTGQPSITSNLPGRVEYDVSAHATGLAPSIRVIVDAGTNDLNTNTDAAAYAALIPYLSSVLTYAPTAKIYVSTLTPNNYAGISNPTQWEARRLLYNADIRGGYAPALSYFDPGSSPSLATPTDAACYQSDKLHWTGTGTCGACASTPTGGGAACVAALAAGQMSITGAPVSPLGAVGIGAALVAAVIAKRRRF